MHIDSIKNIGKSYCWCLAPGIKEKEKNDMDKMKFEEFTDVVTEKIRGYLPKGKFAYEDIIVRRVKKNNDMQLTGLVIKSMDNGICPAIYLEQFFEKYQEGEKMEKILEEIAEMRMRGDLMDSFDVSRITDFEKVKDNIVPRLVSRTWNEGRLQDKPYTEIADLAVTYHILVDNDGVGNASTVINNKIMDLWDIDINKIHELAVKNMARLLPSTFQPMYSFLVSEFDCMSEEDIGSMVPQEELMFVLTNNQKLNGAAAVLDKDIMNMVVEKMGEDFYILPSSVHELIIVRADMGAGVEALNKMVCEVNGSQVAWEEQLSDHVYRYTLEGGLCSA